MMISGRQALAARLLLKLDKKYVVSRIGAYKQTLGKFESRGGPMRSGELETLRQLYELAGAEFVLGGVKMRYSLSEEAAPPTPEQCRAARGLLVFSMEDLAAYAGLSSDVVFNLERGRVPFRSSANKLIAFLDAEGIRLLPGGAQDLRPERYVSPFRRALK